MKCIRLFVSLLIICLFGGSGTLKLMGQSNSAQNLHDTLYEKISYHLERLESDSALAVTDIIYNLYSEKENIYELVRVKVRRAQILRSVDSLGLALDNLLEVRKMVESLEPSDVKSYYYNRLAAVQYERKNADEAIIAVRESQRIDSLKNNKGRILSNLNILGSIYRDRKDWEKSLLFKNQLTGIVAHDIRSPMSSLTGVIHLYNEGFVNNADLKGMMSKLEASAVSVNCLLENVLNCVLNQKEALNPKIESVNLSALLETTMLELESQTKAKSLSIKISGLKNDVFVSADEAMLNLVIRNICSNGMKFSKEGSQLIISYQEAENSKLINIKYFGGGMTKEFKDKLLAEDSRQSQEGTANERGAGLGISLSKDFLSAMNASLDIRSQI
jgi:K+-sensing histidine kinase KdpD